jgi:hypothetical protein
MKGSSMLKILLATLLSAQVWASENNDFNRSCSQAYRVATTDLLRVIDNFQNKRITSTDAAALVASVSGQVKLVRGACVFAESPEARKCSDRYKEIYVDVSSRVSAGALVLGNQKEVDAGFLFVKSLEFKMGLIDLQCQNL